MKICMELERISDILKYLYFYLRWNKTTIMNTLYKFVRKDVAVVDR